jgi:molybdate transport system substrate-binding protein
VTAGHIKILSTHALAEVVEALAPRFAHDSGSRPVFDFDPSQAVARRIAEGEAFDIAIITRTAIDALAAQGKMIAASCVDLASTGLGVAIRTGANKPDIGTVEAFKQTLLSARSVVRSREGASGQSFVTLLDCLGIAEAMRDKITVAGSGRVAEYVARGEAELAVQQISEIVPVAGAELVGPFPAELQVTTTFAAGIAAASRLRDQAAAFIVLLASPGTAPLYMAKGLEPLRR